MLLLCRLDRIENYLFLCYPCCNIHDKEFTVFRCFYRYSDFLLSIPKHALWAKYKHTLLFIPPFDLDLTRGMGIIYSQQCPVFNNPISI